MMIPDGDPRLCSLFLRKELLTMGYDDRTLAAARRSGQLVTPRRGAYVTAEDWVALDAAGRYAVTVRAAYRQAHTPVFISHASSLPFNSAPTWGLDLAEIHLTRDDERTGRREAGVRQHSGQTRDGDVIEAHGLRFSSPIRSALEVITMAGVEVALVVVNHYLHRGDFTKDQLLLRYDAGVDRWPHTLHARLVLDLADSRMESVAESRTSYFLWRQRLPVAVPQYQVRDAHGDLVARLDFAWPDLGIWIEFDGKVKYADHLRPGETAADALMREKRREQLITEITGWRCFRITWEDLERPVELARRLRAFIASVRASRGAAS